MSPPVTSVLALRQTKGTVAESVSVPRAQQEGAEPRLVIDLKEANPELDWANKRLAVNGGATEVT